MALNKADLLVDEEELELVKSEIEALGYEVYIISAVTGKGIDQLLSRCIQMLDEIEEVEPLFELDEEVAKEYTHSPEDQSFSIHIENSRDGKVFVVEGDFSRLLNSVNFDDLDSLGYFQRKLDERGVLRELRKMGIEEEDLVRLEDIELCETFACKNR